MFRMNHFIRLFLSGVLLLTFSGVFGQEQEDRLLPTDETGIEVQHGGVKKAGICSLLYEFTGHGRLHGDRDKFIWCRGGIE